MADEERPIQRARLIGPKNYKTVYQKLHYEAARELEKARQAAEAKAAIPSRTVLGAPRPEFGPPTTIMDGDFIDQRPLLPSARAVAIKPALAMPGPYRKEEQATEERTLVGTRGKATRTPEGWETQVDVQPWRGVPYPLEPAIGHFVERRPYNLLEQAQQCWTDRGSLDLRDVDMATAAGAGVKQAVKSAASGGAKAAAIGWLGGGAEIPAVAMGVAAGGGQGFARGAAWSAVEQMCRPKVTRR